jgi:hypothetical protein
MSNDDLECMILNAIDELYSEVRQHWGDNSDTATQFEGVSTVGSRPRTAKSLKSFDSRKSRQSLLSSGTHRSRQSKKSIFDTDTRKKT